MANFSLLEEVLGLPLYVADAYNHFEIEADGLPNGDACLKINGDISDLYKAVMPAPTMSPRDVCNQADVTAGDNWAMSCWIKIPSLAAYSSNIVMLGCSTYELTNPLNTAKNLQSPFLLGMTSLNTLSFFREGRSNISSPASSQAILASLAAQTVLDRWALLVVNVVTTGTTTVTASMYVDTFHSAGASDSLTRTALSGTLGSPRYLHIGAIHSGATSRPDIWRIAKWAFHDHALSQSERQAMWEAMMGDAVSRPKVHTDDFNRASLGGLWHTFSGTALIALGTNNLNSSGTTIRAGQYTQDLGSPDHYAQADVTSLGGRTNVVVRGTPYGGAANPSYIGGWANSNNRWEILGNGATLATSTSSPPSSSHTVRLEARTVAGDVELKLYDGNTLVLSTTDSGVNKLLTNTVTGIYMRGRTSPSTLDATMDNFECGTL